MLGLGMGEMLIVAGVALVVVGPERLPRVMRQLGRWYGQARRAADELRRAFVLEADRQDATDRYKALQARRAKERLARNVSVADAEPTQVIDAAMGPVPQLPSPPAPSIGEDSEPPDDDVIDPNAHPPDAPHPDAALLQAADEGR